MALALPPAASCKHCDAPLLTSGSEFCCKGCETAFRIIRAGGMEEYYRFRDPNRARPVGSFTTSFAYLNSADYRARHVHEEGISRLTRIREIIFDKTGILTRGTPVIVASKFFVPNRHWLEAAILALESGTNHPIVEAFRSAVRPRLTIGTTKKVRVLPGSGIRGLVDGADLIVASPKVFI